ncbi:MAG: YwiC-like family protein [Terracidiphilus sp.]
MTNPAPVRSVRYLPREHGATAMLLTPIVCAAVLARAWRWAELATLLAAFAAMAAKDPLVVLLRQRFVWKQAHPETSAAARWFAGWVLVLGLCGFVLLAAWPLRALAAFALGIGLFGVLAIWVNVRNRQRSTLFQIASAAALTSTSVAASLSAAGSVPPWGWWLWALLALQATAGILVVHARLDARIALRSGSPGPRQFRRAAFAAVAVLAAAAVAAISLHRFWIAAALLLAVAGYLSDLRSQRSAASLQMPLKRVGLRALTLSSIYAILLILGLW